MKDDRMPFRKCKICGVEVESTLSFPSRPSAFRVHLRTSHPEFVTWQRRRNRIFFVLFSSSSALLLLAILNQNFQYASYGCIAAIILLGLWDERRKMRAFRDAWKQAHFVLDSHH